MNKYIGISGFMTSDEVRSAIALFPECGRQLMVGVLASQKTVLGDGNSKPKRYPKPENFAEIFVDDKLIVESGRCLNLIHYAADDSEELGFALRTVMIHGGPRCHGVQVNVAWPSLRELMWFRRFFPHERIVLQIGRRAIEEMDLPLNLIVSQLCDDLVRRIEPYANTITDVLLDPSGGTGLENDFDDRVPRAIMRRFPQLGVGVAGGACAEHLPAPEIMRDVSIDAESQLRCNGPGGGMLMMSKVGTYLKAVAEMVRT